MFNLWHKLKLWLHGQKDYGVRVRKPRRSDYKDGDDRLAMRLGAYGGEVRSDGQWVEDFENTVPELQKREGFETFYCVTGSAIRFIQILLYNLGISKNKSERYTAKKSGTTRNGNYLYKVGDSINNDGVVDEEVWPWPKILNWTSFYQEIPEDVTIKGELWKTEYKTGYEWVRIHDKVARMNQLKKSPLQIIVKAWFRRENGMYYFPDGAVYNHAVLLIGYKEGEYWLVGDQYEPFVKKIEWDAPIYEWAMRYSITKLSNETMNTLKSKKKSHIYAILPDGSKSRLLNWRTYIKGLKNGLFKKYIEVEEETLDKYLDSDSILLTEDK